jgi:hypothetical protein
MLWEIREIVNGSIWSVNGLGPGEEGILQLSDFVIG